MPALYGDKAGTCLHCSTCEMKAMSTTIIYAPPGISEWDFDSFLDAASLPEPWALTVEHFLAPCEPVPPAAVPRRPTTLATCEPGRWRDVLFEPGAVVEIRSLARRDVHCDK